MGTRLWSVQSHLVTLFTAATSDDVMVFQAPRLRSGKAPRTCVIVGSDGGEDSLADGDGAISATQEPSGLGPGTWFEETGSVTCSIWTWGGQSDLEAIRTAADTTLDECKSAITSDTTLRDITQTDGFAHISEIDIREKRTTNGPAIRVVFVVTYTALIT